MKKSIFKKLIKNPALLIFPLQKLKISNLLLDETFIKLKYKAIFNKKLNLENPSDFNEKLQWLKLYDRRPEYVMFVDKFEVRKYVKKAIGEEYLVPLYGVWENFNEINFSNLPDRFVIKCTHDSGGIVICTSKEHFNLKMAKDKITHSLKRNYYYVGREWPYKNVVHHHFLW